MLVTSPELSKISKTRIWRESISTSILKIIEADFHLFWISLQWFTNKLDICFHNENIVWSSDIPVDLWLDGFLRYEKNGKGCSMKYQWLIVLLGINRQNCILRYVHFMQYYLEDFADFSFHATHHLKMVNNCAKLNLPLFKHKKVLFRQDLTFDLQIWP